MIVRITRKPRRKRIVILGGGFGGVYAALRLEKLLRQSSSTEICLISRENFFLFTPMLHEIAASDLEITNIVNPLRKLLRRTEVIVGSVDTILLETKQVVVRGLRHDLRQLSFDHLVIALGSESNFHGLPGVADLSLPMKTLRDAVQLRSRVIQNLEEANSADHARDRESLVTFVVAGGGFAGVETIAALNDFVRQALPFFPKLREEMLRFVLVHSGPAILPELGDELGCYCQNVLSQRGVDILLNVRVREMSANCVRLTDGGSIRSRTLVWTAGTAPSPIISSLSCVKNRGRVVVDQFLRVPNWPNVWAVGDCAAVPDMGRPANFHPATAQHAIRQGRIVARNIIATLRGQQPTPFSFRTIGLLASIGRRRGVARIFGRNFSGFFAWWMWRTIYLFKLPGLDKKVRVAFDWTLDLLFPKDVCAVGGVETAPISSGPTKSLPDGQNGDEKWMPILPERTLFPTRVYR